MICDSGASRTLFKPSLPHAFNTWRQMLKSCVVKINTWNQMLKSCIVEINIWHQMLKSCIVEINIWNQMLKSCIMEINIWNQMLKSYIVNIDTWYQTLKSCFRRAQKENITEIASTSTLRSECYKSVFFDYQKNRGGSLDPGWNLHNLDEYHISSHCHKLLLSVAV